MKIKQSKKLKIIKLISLIGYIVCVFVLIFESCMQGAASASQSNAVGGTIADIFNNLGGDQTEKIKPTSLTIDNKITTANIGDTYSISSTTLPNEATYKSIEYFSSDKSIAKVDNDGIITFIDSGEVTITIRNEEYNDIKDTMTINVSSVNATSISSSIENAIKENEVYTLYLGEDYPISTIFSPINTTNKDLSYETSNEEFLTIDENGIITPIKHSFDTQTTITIKHNELINTLNVIVKNRDIIEVTSISASDFEIIKTQTIAIPDLQISPSEATYKDLTYLIEDNTVISISGNKVRGLKVGKTNLTISSTYYPSVSKTVEVTVNPQPQITNFALSFPSNLVVGTSKKIVFSAITPNFADTSSAIYESDNASIATVSSTGTVKGISLGTTTIQVTINSIVKSFDVTIIENSDPSTTSFDLTYDEKNLILEINNNYSLSTLFKASNFKPSTPVNTSLTYSIIEGINVGTITNGVLSLVDIGDFTIECTHVTSGISKTISLISYSPFSVTLDENEVEELSIVKGNTSSLNIVDEIDEAINTKQEYILSIDVKDIIQLNGSSKEYIINTFKQGTALLTITPCVKGVLVKEKSKVIEITVIDIYTSDFDISVIDIDTEEEIYIKNYEITIYRNDNVKIIPSLSNSSTISKVTFTSNDQSILKINSNGTISPLKIGTTEIVAVETYSSLSKGLKINVINKIEFNDEVKIKSDKITFDKDNKLFKLTNGHSGKISISLTEDSTYKTLTYASSDENILTVGKDGTITPIKAGKAQISITCDDGFSPSSSVTIDIQIERQPLISDLATFFRYVRKGLGHFGAFLVLGIFQTFTYLLYFSKKRWPIVIPANFVLGFLTAGLTELIQLYVPGRYGSMKDVLIDFAGFIISAFIISAIFVAVYFIKKYKNKTKENKQDKIK